jgi:predicted pyridoxine 5'-phosphate oxidase superfamily flavin-nucleotide-binding protein
MASFGSIAFSSASKKFQEKYGSRVAYQKMEARSVFQGLTEMEKEFIATRDSFYMASLGESGYPYIQHRGGPKGFLKVIDSQTLAFPDFSGNKQYITAGNVTTEKKVSLILMDYAAQARLKIYAKAEIVAWNDRPDLVRAVALENYAARTERIMLLKVDAYDWNCPQHITPRFTQEEIEEALAPQREYIAKLESEIRELKLKLKP